MDTVDKRIIEWWKIKGKKKKKRNWGRKIVDRFKLIKIKHRITDNIAIYNPKKKKDRDHQGDTH